ncbi:unnamed protein product [Closterium sp. NIES-64]|nr:unnamed protein product [Closterium sp. NIES-64]
MDDAGATRPTWQQTVATTRRRVVARRWRRETLLATRLTHARPRRLLHPLLALPAVFLLLLASPRALVRSRVVLSGDANLRLPATAAARGAASGAGRADAAAWPSTREGALPGKLFSSATTLGSDSDSAIELGSAASRRVASRAPWAAAIAKSLTRRGREDGEGGTGGEDEGEGRTSRAGRKREAVAGTAGPIVLPLQRQVRRAHSRERKTGGGERSGAEEAPRAGGGGEGGTRRRQLRGLPLELRGSVLELGYYYVTLYLGWPPQRFALIADTGSSITYVPCAACTHCGNHQDPRFNPALSASYATIPCAHPRCLTHACSPTGLCTYHGVYAEASSTRGLLASDLLSFAPPPLSPSAPHPAAAQPHVPAAGVHEARSPSLPTPPAAAAAPLNASRASSSSLPAAAAGRAGERVLLAGTAEVGVGSGEGGVGEAWVGEGAGGEGGGGEGEGGSRVAEQAVPDGPRLVFGRASAPTSPTHAVCGRASTSPHAANPVSPCCQPRVPMLPTPCPHAANPVSPCCQPRVPMLPTPFPAATCKSPPLPASPLRATCKSPPRYLQVPSALPASPLRATCKSPPRYLQVPSALPASPLRATCKSLTFLRPASHTVRPLSCTVPPGRCELQETGDLYLQRADGIVGLGRDALSLPNQLVRAGVMHDDVFSLCFAAPARPAPAPSAAADAAVEHAADGSNASSHGGGQGEQAGTAHEQGGGQGEGGEEGGIVDAEGEGGELILGRVEELPGTVWTPLLPSARWVLLPSTRWVLLPSASETPYYIVSVEEMVVGQQRVAVAAAVWEEGPYGGVMLDSGTTFSYLPSPAFHAFHALVRAAVPLPQVPGPDARYSDICFANVSAAGGMNRLFPSATVVFGNGAALRLLPHNYLFKHKKHEDAVCLGVFDNGSGGALIGGVAVRGMRVTYDREHHRIGFAPHNCPLRPSPPPPAAAASSPSLAHSPQAPPLAASPSAAAHAPPRPSSAEATAVPDQGGSPSSESSGRVGAGSAKAAGKAGIGVGSSSGGEDTEEGGEGDERVEGNGGRGEDEEKAQAVGGGLEGAEMRGAVDANSTALEGAWAGNEEQWWWDAVSRSVLLGGGAGGGGEGRAELASWNVSEELEGSGKVEEEEVVGGEGEHEEEGEEESEGSEGGGSGGSSDGGSSDGGSSDGGTDVVLAAAQQHLLTRAGQWSSCTHTPVSIVKEASRKYTTIRWCCTGRGGQRVLWDAEEAVRGAVTPAGDSEADGGMAHGRAEGAGRTGGDGDGGEQDGVAASGAGVEGGEQRGAAEWSGGSDGQHSQSHSHTHLLLHLVFSARHPPLLPPLPPSTSAPSASAAPLSLPPSVSTTPPLPTVLPALLPAVAAVLLVRPTRMALAAFSSSTLLLPSPPRPEGEDGHGRGSTGDAHDSQQQQRQRHFTTASLTIDCPSPRAHRTAPARTCSHEAQRLARLVRAGRCQGVGERVQRAMRGEGAVGKAGSGDSPVLLRCSLHTLPPAAAASTRSPPDHGGTPALSDSPLATSSHAAAALAHEQWQAEYGHEESRVGGAAAGVRGAGEGQMGRVGKGEADGGEEGGDGMVGEMVKSVLGGAAMHARQQQSVHEGSDVAVMRSITLTLREEQGAAATAATGATPPTPSAVAAAVVPAVVRMQEEQRLQWAALVVVYALVAVCLALILRLQFRRGAFAIAITTVAAAAATAGGMSAARPHQLCSHSPYGTCSCPVAKRAVDRCHV